MNFIRKHPYFMSVLVALMLGWAAMTVELIRNQISYSHNLNPKDLWSVLMLGALVGILFIYPFILTALNIVFLFVSAKCSKAFGYITMTLGIIYSLLYSEFIGIVFDADWTETLYNTQVHTPIFTKSYGTVLVIALVAILGYLILSLVPLKKLSPLMIVSGISAMYLGIFEAVLWIIQVFPQVFLILLPANFIIISIKTIVEKIRQWDSAEWEKKEYKNPLLKKCNQYLMKASKWPLAAFFLMWPMLGIIICLLVLFGQQPDAAIKAWTETSDWNLSKRVAPQNVFYDEHYLCTVAAGGHASVVKPIRLGVRHGHEVIVNRQLSVANAFEQILEEKTPKLHRQVRKFYDHYGFPVAKMIHSPYVADLIYFLMKPLEWLFLIVLYFCDVNPENRIAVQYLPKRVSF